MITIDVHPDWSDADWQKYWDEVVFPAIQSNPSNFPSVQDRIEHFADIYMDDDDNPLNEQDAREAAWNKVIAMNKRWFCGPDFTKDELNEWVKGWIEEEQDALWYFFEYLFLPCFDDREQVLTCTTVYKRFVDLMDLVVGDHPLKVVKVLSGHKVVAASDAA